MAEVILRLPVVLARTGYRRSTLYAEIAKGAFPRQISLGARSVGWIESEIDTWIAERIQASRGPARSPAAAPDRTSEVSTCA